MFEYVQTEVIGTRKTLVALGTLERSLPRVSTVVACELVRAAKGPVTLFPRTLEGFLSGVDPLVGLEVGALGVHLVALGVVALEDTLCAGGRVRGDGARHLRGVRL